MEKKALLQRIGQLYDSGENIIRYLNEGKENSIEDIMISYDFQAGTYSKHYYENPQITQEQCDCLWSYIKEFAEIQSIFEAGVGEGNKLVTILNKTNVRFGGGCDISWSRVKAAQAFAKDNLLPHRSATLFVGDMKELPLKNDSIDLVYTMYALEPNGGHEKELIKELYRVTRKWLVLVEPAYELANNKQRERMDYHGYVKGLKQTAEQCGYKVITYEKFAVDENPLNPSAIMIIEKEPKNLDIDQPLCCPITKTDITHIGNAFFSRESLLSYPIINGVACLTKDNAVVTTKMEAF